MLGQTARKTILFVFQKQYCASDTRTRNEDIDGRFCRQIKKCFYAGKIYGTDCIQTINDPNKFKNAFVIPTIRDEGATRHNCSWYFHICLQSNNGSCRGGEFRDG